MIVDLSAQNESLFEQMMTVRRFNSARDVIKALSFPYTHLAAVPEGLRQHVFEEGFTAWRQRHSNGHALTAARFVVQIVTDYRVAQAAVREDSEAPHA